MSCIHNWIKIVGVDAKDIKYVEGNKKFTYFFCSKCKTVSDDEEVV